MKVLNKILVMLTVMLVFVSIVGCSKKTENPDGAQSETNEAVSGAEVNEDTTVEKEEIDMSEKVEFTYWLNSTPDDLETDYSKNAIVQYMNNKFNMNLVFQQPSSGTETDSLNLMFGTGEYTDLIESSYYTGSLDQLYDDGVIIDIATYLDDMPNFKALLEADPVFKKNVYNDRGQILKLPTYITEDPMHWGGLVYRRDILETMTGNNVVFPSGKDVPTTIDDWEYMLPLYKQYFEASGLTEYAPLIIPASGYFTTSELVTSFGTAASYYVEDDEIKYGPVEEEFRNYLTKMNEWYNNGYIYKDFASRTNDPFYLPNTSLTYGAAAGIWFGLTGQLDDRLSMPDYGLYVDIQPLLNPIDEKNGVTSAPNMMYAPRNDQYGGAMITSTCDNIERLLVFIDYMYSEEAAMLKEYGITKEQGADQYELYQKYELTDGAYTIDSNGNFQFHEKLAPGSELSPNSFVDYKMPGLRNNTYTNQFQHESFKNATKVWLNYGVSKLPPLYRTEDEDTAYSSNQSKIDDYVNSMVLKFILGTEELNDTSWAEYIKQIEDFGVTDNINIMQTAYDRYLNR